MEGSRRLERERVLELLYEADAKGVSAPDLIADLPVEPEPFVRELVLGVDAETGELDATITERARNWDLDRMPVIDKIILRMGLWELHHHPDTPVAVVISEAVELAKTFSTDKSGGFVNGILGKL